MLFDEENQEYCRYRNDVGPADWRAPEEYADRPLNEKIDVWSLGNNFVSLIQDRFHLSFWNKHSTRSLTNDRNALFVTVLALDRAHGFLRRMRL
jgi:serine/threonine protein kinase